MAAKPTQKRNILQRKSRPCVPPLLYSPVVPPLPGLRPIGRVQQGYYGMYADTFTFFFTSVSIYAYLSDSGVFVGPQMSYVCPANIPLGSFQQMIIRVPWSNQVARSPCPDAMLLGSSYCLSLIYPYYIIGILSLYYHYIIFIYIILYI